MRSRIVALSAPITARRARSWVPHPVFERAPWASRCSTPSCGSCASTPITEINGVPARSRRGRIDDLRRAAAGGGGPTREGARTGGARQAEVVGSTPAQPGVTRHCLVYTGLAHAAPDKVVGRGCGRGCHDRRAAERALRASRPLRGATARDLEAGEGLVVLERDGRACTQKRVRAARGYTSRRRRWIDARARREHEAKEARHARRRPDAKRRVFGKPAGRTMRRRDGS